MLVASPPNDHAFEADTANPAAAWTSSSQSSGTTMSNAPHAAMAATSDAAIEAASTLAAPVVAPTDFIAAGRPATVSPTTAPLRMLRITPSNASLASPVKLMVSAVPPAAPAPAAAPAASTNGVADPALNRITAPPARSAAPRASSSRCSSNQVRSNHPASNTASAATSTSAGRWGLSSMKRRKSARE